MVEKHRNFVQAYLQCFDAAEAARRAQCGADALARPAVRRELAAQRSRGVPGREDALRRLAQIAFGRANDCVRLVLEDDPPIGELDLTLLSEVKRSERGPSRCGWPTASAPSRSCCRPGRRTTARPRRSPRRWRSHDAIFGQAAPRADVVAARQPGRCV